MRPDQYLIVDLRTAWRRHDEITFWQPDNAGYTSQIEQAGSYGIEAMRSRPGYYRERVGRGRYSRYAVPRAIVDTLAVADTQGCVVPNTPATRRTLARARLALPCHV